MWHTIIYDECAARREKILDFQTSALTPFDSYRGFYSKHELLLVDSRSGGLTPFN